MKKRGDLSNGLPPDDASGREDSEPRPNGLDRTTELALIDVALLDNVQAFSELFEHYRPALYGLCSRRLNDPSLAEDVVQEAFIKAFKNLSSYDRRKPVWPWLSTLATRMCVDLQRHRALTQYFADLGVAVDENAEIHGHARSALDEVMASEDRAELWRAVRVLPKRQRRALLLYALGGLSYADIAAAEGISIGAVKLLIVRARRKMRAGGSLPAIVFPFRWLRWKLQRIEERIRPLLGVYTEGFSTACAQAACLGALVTVMVATSFPNKPFYYNDAVPSVETGIPATVFSAMQSRTLQTALPNVVAPAKASAASQQSVAETTTSLANRVINPGENATPETTIFSSITASPNYESDHTILALGYCWACGSNVLFVSNDGAANWKPLTSRLFFGYNLTVPPGYPQDRRMFALGDLGLQQSDDGGGIFRTVSPSVGFTLAISPSFGRGDSKILIGGKTVLEYDAGTGVTQPRSLDLPPAWGGGYGFVAFSPSYPSDHTVFAVSQDYAKDTLASTRYETILHRCRGPACDEMHLPISWPPMLRLSPRFDQDGLAYAFSGNTLLVSHDGTRTFQEIQIPLPDRGSININDVAILWSAPSDPAIFVAVDGFGPDAPDGYRSLDAGRSWNKISIDLPDFSYGAEKLIVTPTGRLLATGTNGIACSEDKGKTWAPRCTPEQ